MRHCGPDVPNPHFDCGNSRTSRSSLCEMTGPNAGLRHFECYKEHHFASEFFWDGDAESAVRWAQLMPIVLLMSPAVLSILGQLAQPRAQTE